MVITVFILVTKIALTKTYLGFCLFHDICVLCRGFPSLVELQPALNLLPQMLTIHIRRHIYTNTISPTN